MNKVYKVVWNVTLGTWVAVSELAKGRSKTKSKTLNLLALPLITTSILCSAEVLAASYSAGGGNAAVTNSVAIGTDATTASTVTGANQSVAIGYSTKASGDQTVALGANVIASGNSAIAIGGDDIDRIASNKAVNDSYEALTGVRLVAGNVTGGSYRSTTASGAGAVALGTQSAASGSFSTAVGMTSTASGAASSALGVFAEASGGAALAIGAISKAKAEQSIALGTNAVVNTTASNSIAIGNGAVANNKDSIAIGSGSTADSKTLLNQAYLVGGTTTGEMNIGNRRITGVSAGSDDTDAVNVSQLKQVAEDAAAKTTVSNGKNITVKETLNNDGSSNYEVATADDLNVTSVTAGNSTLDTNGLTITGGPSVLASGIDAGAKKVTNVANGDISSVSKDAVNGSQLSDLIGAPVTTDSTGKTVIPNLGGTTANNINDAIQQVNNTANAGWNVTGSGANSANIGPNGKLNVVGDSNISVSQTGTDQDAQLEINLAKDLTVDSITAGNTLLNQSGLSFITNAGDPAGPSITSTGINAGDYKITQVGKGDISSTSTDAINGSQLFAVQQTVDNVITNALQGVQAKFSVATNGDDPSLVGEGAILDIGTDAGETNLKASRIGTTIDFGLNKDLKLDSVATGATKISDAGLQFVNNAGIVTGPTVTSIGISAGDLKVTNVANGDISSASKDAVNGSQLSDLIGAPVTTDSTGKTVTPNLGGTTANNINDAIQQVNDTANKGFALKAQDGKTVQKALGEAVEVVGADKNIQTLATNGQIQIRLSDDVSVANSITAGGNTLNATGLTVGDSSLTTSGLTIANGGPSVTANGIDAGKKVISSVAAGAISSTSTDAVNGSQLYVAQNNVANVIGGDTKIDPNTGNITTSNIGGTGKNTISEAVAAAKTTVSKGKNMEVKATQNADGSTNYEVATADDLDVTSVKAGDTLINSNGLTIANGPSITASGIDAGNKVVSSVAAGIVSSISTDAVNGSQLYNAQNNIANVIGGSTVIDPTTGAVTTSNIGGTGKNTISDAVAAAKTTVTEGKNITVKETKNADGSSNYQVATVDDLDVKSLTAGNTLINNNGLSITGGPSVLASGINAADKKITHVANGDVSTTSSDAVNGSQLYAVDSRIDAILNQNIANLEQGFSLTANGQNNVAVVAGATIDIGTATDEKNLTVSKSGNTIDFALNPDLNVTSVTAGGTVLNNDGLSFIGLDVDGLPVKTGPSIGINGIDAGNQKISHVANGDISANSKDAVNGSQLFGAQNNVAQVIGGDTSIDPNTGKISTSNIGGTGKNTISEAVAAAKTTVSKGKNIEVKATQNADGSNNYEVATAEDLDVTSLKVGNTTVNNNGLTIVGGPSIVASGIDAANKKVSNVANGNVSASSKDAVNGSQLFNAQNNVMNIIGGESSIDPNTGNIATSNIGGTGKNTIDEAVAAAKTKVSQGKNMVVTETKNADGSSDYKVATADNLDVTSLKAGNSVVNNQGLTIVGGPSILVSGINAGSKKITNVASGSITATSQDAVNGSQLYAVDSRLDSIINKNINALEKGFNLSADGQDEKAILAGETIDIGTASTETNLTVSKTGNTIDFALNRDLTLDSVNANGTIINGDGLSFQSIDADGNIIIAGPSINATGINAGNTVIKNVSNGAVTAASKDAVNGSQLYDAQDNVANIIGGNTTIDPNTGNITASDIGGTGANNIHDAIQSVNNAAANANQGWNVSTNGGTASNVKPGNTVDFSNTDKNVTISNTGNEITVNLNKDQNLGKDGSLTIGNAKLDNNGLTIAGGPSITANGIDAGNKQMTNVADGEIASGSKDAVNGGQIYDMMGAGAYDNQGNLSNIGGTGETNINDAIASVNQAAIESKTTVEAGTNIKVSTNKNTDGSTNYVVATQDDITLNSVTAKEVKADKVVAGNTTIDNNGVSIKDGPSMTTSGVDAGNKNVTNVSNGVQNSDAVNMGQMAQYLGGGAGYNNITESFDAPTYNVNGGTHHNVGDALGALNQADQVLGDRITNLGDQLQQAFYSTNQRIDDVEKRANAGIAAAMAMETAPYVPGKYTYAAAASYHGGENAVGVTFRKTADNGRWSLTSGVAFASQGDPSVRVGISGVID